MPKSDSIIISSTIGTESRKIARPMPPSVKSCSDPRAASRNVAQRPEGPLRSVAVAAPTVSIGSCILPPLHKLIGGQSPPQIYFHSVLSCYSSLEEIRSGNDKRQI